MIPRRILGRRACHWCGFAHAHVRQTEGKQAYVYCPECGITTTARNGAQTTLLTKGMRPELGAVPPPEPPIAADPIIVPGGAQHAKVQPQTAEAAAPAAPRKPASWIDQLLKA